MAAWKKLIYSGSDAELNNLDVLKASGSFSGSFQGEVLGTMDSASVAVTAQTASVALRANALAPTATASFADSATSASHTAGTASIANNATSASFAVLAGTIRSGLTASYADSATTASHTAGTASIANIATYTSEWVLGANGSSDYTFTGPGFTASTADPDIYLIRGQQYKFTNKSGGHPFRIQTTVNGSTGTQYNNGITNNDAGNNETLTFNVSMEAPEVLYYQCTSHAAMGGPIYILDTSPVSSSFATSASIATTSQTASVALRANALSPLATASNADTATSASRAATGDGIFSGSFSGSYQGDGSDLTGIATTLTVDGDSGTSPVSLTDDDLQILGTTNEIVTAITKVGTDVKATISLPDDVTIGNDITITRDALIQRNLTVRGTASFEATADLNIADRFIGLASGSAATGDGGINIQQGANGRGEGFGFENSVSRWGVTSSFDPLGNTITPDAFMTVNVSDGSANDPTAIAARYQKNGNIFIGNTGDIWIYS